MPRRKQLTKRVLNGLVSIAGFIESELSNGSASDWADGLLRERRPGSDPEEDAQRAVEWIRSVIAARKERNKRQPHK